jgi:hypothetical protein
MLDGSIPLTSTIPITPTSASGNNSEFVSQQSIPLTMGLNEKVTVSITFKNAGTSTWTKAGGYMLGSQNSQDNTTWGLNRVSLGDSDVILPGEVITFVFEINGPSIAGNNNFQWKMIQENVEWFGASSPNKVIRVGDGGNYLDDCDTKSNWNPWALTLNTSNKVQGLGCLEFIGSLEPEYSKVFSPAYKTVGSDTGATLQFWYYVSDVSLLTTNNQVEIGSSGAPDQNEYSWELNGLVNGWNFIQLKTNVASKIGNPNLGAINWFRLYRFKTGSVTTRIDAIELLGGNLSIDDFDTNLSLSLYPNPTETEVNIGFNLLQSSTISFTVVNVLGQVVLQSSNSKQVSTGNHTLRIPLQSLNTGVYMVVLKIDDKMITKRILKK